MRLVVAVLFCAASLARGQPASSESGPAPFAASWVWIGGDDAPKNAYAYFRRSVRLRSDPSRATLRVSADSRYRLWVNGQLLGSGPARCDPVTQSFDTYDVTTLLHAGINAIAATVHHFGEGTFSYIPGRAGFLVDGAVTTLSGDVIDLGTGESWRCLGGSGWTQALDRMDVQLDFPEVFDLRQEPVDFRASDFDDAAWAPAVPIGKPPVAPWTSLVPNELPRFKLATVAPRALVESGDVLNAWPYYVDLAALFATDHAIAYVATQVESDSDREAVLALGSDDGVRVIWNGAEVFARHEHGPAKPGDQRVPLSMRRGWNALVFKVEQLSGPWELYFDFEAKDGTRLEPSPALATRGRAGGATVEVAGPYPNAERPGAVCAGFDAVYPPEAELASRGGLPSDDAAHPWRLLTIGRDAAATAADRHVASILATEIQRPAAPATPPRITDPLNLLVADSRPATLRSAPGVSAYVVIDFGREVFGRPVVEITGAKGGVVDLGYSEKLDGGRVDPTRGGVRYADRIRLRDGAQTFETFEKRAFRYLKLVARDLAGPLYVDFVGVREEAYPLADYSDFECSDPLLNQIFSISKHTLRLCMEDAYIDCPWRERGQWWGDARVEALVNYVVFGDVALVRKGLRQLGQSQRPDGSLLALYPASSIAKDFVIPDYVAIWISSIWDYFVFTGDVGPLRELFPRIEKALAWFETLEGTEGLLRDVKGWVFIDWADIDKRGECGPLNAFYLAALDDAARIAETTGRADRATEWKARAARVREAFAKRLWSSESKRFVDCRVGDELSARASLHANALPLILGIGSDEQRRGALEFLRTTLEKDPIGGASPYFDTYLLEALFREGCPADALSLIRSGWKWMLDRGATTCFEMYDENASLCHGWSAGPAFFLLTEVLGVKPLRSGFTEILVHPNVIDLSQARGTLATPRGFVAVAWKASPAPAFEMSLRVREAVPIAIDVPLREGAKRVIVDKIVVWPEDEAKGQKPPNVVGMERIGDRLRVRVNGRNTYQVKVE